jgi:hypothetical protein
LILNILITNLDSWIFYQILISFQFHPWIHDFIFLIFSCLVLILLNFYFCFELFCEFDFSF